jgi:hypothetical protein
VLELPVVVSLVFVCCRNASNRSTKDAGKDLAFLVRAAYGPVTSVQLAQLPLPFIILIAVLETACGCVDQ